MNEEQLARFEANIEQLVESAFANFFGKKIRAQDIALHLARAMEDNLRPAHGGDARPIAPDHYIIVLNPHIHTHLVQRQPSLPQTLSQHMVMLAVQTDYRLLNVPIIDLVSEATLDKNQIRVEAAFTERPENSTAAMQQVKLPTEEAERYLNASLLINAERSIPLKDDIINIGRYRDNDIIVDDPYVSRHHLQLRKRFGVYMLFDVHSQGGTFVNGVRIKEHQLQTGDVIQIGRTKIVYMEDNPLEDSHLSQTDALDPIL